MSRRRVGDLPTLEQIRSWPATVDIPRAATAFGISRAQGYALLRRGQFPAEVITIGGRHRVVTASILRALDAGTGGGPK